MSLASRFFMGIFREEVGRARFPLQIRGKEQIALSFRLFLSISFERRGIAQSGPRDKFAQKSIESEEPRLRDFAH